MHLYIMPFSILYPIWAYAYYCAYEKYIRSEEWTFVTLGGLITLNTLIWLGGHWSKNNVKTCGLIKIKPSANQGQPEICPLVHTKIPGHDDEISFLFQKKRFIYSYEKKQFQEMVFPIDSDPFTEDILSSPGLKTSDIAFLTRHYGLNKFDIPVPSFKELFKEHAVAPFFVFQIFCVGLWCLDEYWYYSLFTLVMLVIFESTVVWQRQRTLNEFRTMSIKPYSLLAKRDGKWTAVQSDELFPGDIVSITRTKDDSGLPCDLILLQGTAIVNEAMLSGESTPLLKENLQPHPGPLDTTGTDKNSLLWGGTKVLQVTPSPEHSTPDNGAIALVTKTGFETSQGNLVRTMIFSTERVTANNVEALLFILFLLCFAIAASWYVWQEGIRNERKKSKLLLDCILIVTSVVPPELPMELSLAVNTSLAALSRHAIFCTEPFRIPFAGRVDVICFDKTGTLTGENLVVEGIAGLSRDILNPKNAPENTKLVLGTAHALVKLDDEVVGDPMEKAAIESLGWKVGKKDLIFTNVGEMIQIKKRFQFSSQLKRSSSIFAIAGRNFVSVKGAPETIRSMLKDVPTGYDDCYKKFGRMGSRVLALALKPLDISVGKVVREQAESQLQFVGFLIFNCPLKPDAVKTIEMLNESSHRCVMITGDNPLTAVHVAEEVKIVERKCLILDDHNDGTSVPLKTMLTEDISFKSVDEKINIKVDLSAPIDTKLFQKHDICITGHALAQFQSHPDVLSLLLNTWVYARVSPLQKEWILASLKNAGLTTLMCGDGTNDVGALKQAHIGVALLNGSEEDLQKIAQHQRTTRFKEIYEKQIQLAKRFNAATPPIPLAIAHLYPPGSNNPHRERALQAMGKTDGDKAVSTSDTPTNAAAQLSDKMLASMMDEDNSEPPTIKLGDASVAAPFTSKLSNVMAIANIIRQGRCTLVATIQMYKILALNCLISAYSLSVLYLKGIKFGDGQATISGMLMSVCFLCISRAKPIEKLSKERPQPNIWNWYIMGSVLGQFAIHIVTLIYISGYVEKFETPESKVDLEAEFKPSLLNSAIYLLQLAQQVSTFAVNYQGHPHRERIRDNKGMYYGLLGVGAIALSCATEFIPELNEKMRLVKFTQDFKLTMTTVMIIDFVGCWVVEQIFKWGFADLKAKRIAERRR
ncbi:Manganese-transporting ATPase 1 [Neolecta irregularis DAH-3]|uniref:Manganese-transporting ATPase 1 n=1 Tax=Neolecta irregularis (strain DAH-3) TaxID=1198029 RepID=A0A1U7LQZ1_NEOID|nr:Manganese-transporting ATPase 1 [Neolecta irregularis DAH-3]|eukprot:OLL25049.1 Manganese-transporting ATPase 1 [Neolecta irregularis DAH-3]